MTMSLTDVAIEQFNAAFQNEYQASRKLEGVGQVVRGVVGDAYKFKLVTAAQAQLRGASQSPIPASDLTYTAPTVSFNNWVVNYPTDIFDQAEVNANERKNLALEIAIALGRREDQFLIDAFDASGTTKTVAVGTTNLTKAKLISAAKLLNDDEVPMEERHAIIGSSQLDSLLRDTDVTSTDYNNVRALVNGQLDTFMGFKFHVIGDRKEGGLTKTVNNRDVFFCHTRSVGLAYGLDPTVSVDWSAERQSYLSIGKVRGGAVAIDTKGIVKVTCDETK